MSKQRRDQVEIGKRLREARNAAKLRQQDVEEATGISHSVLSDMENGKRSINAEWAEKFSNAIPNLLAADLQSVVSPSLLATVRELERLVRDRLPAPQVEAAPDLKPIVEQARSSKSKTARATQKAADLSP